MKVQGILFLFLVVLGCGGCTPTQTMAREPQGPPLVTPGDIVPTQPPQSTLPLLSPTLDWLTPASPGLPTQADDSWMTPIAPGLQALVEKTKEDLAKRLSIPQTEINVAEVTEETWPDSSLGCGKPGTEYLPVITPGFRISLEAGGQMYSYHTNTSSQIILCSQQLPLGIRATP